MTSLEKLTIDELGDRRAALRQELAAVTEVLQGRIVAAVEAKEVSEAEASRRGKVDRMIVRKWLGKGPRR